MLDSNRTEARLSRVSAAGAADAVMAVDGWDTLASLSVWRGAAQP